MDISSLVFKGKKIGKARNGTYWFRLTWVDKYGLGKHVHQTGYKTKFQAKWNSTRKFNYIIENGFD